MAEKQRACSTDNLYSFDKKFMQQNGIGSLCAIDEAGRGPLAGPVVAASVILDYDNTVDKINDSKKLSEKIREELFPLIKERALCWSVGIATVQEIDKFNILQATFMAMCRALQGLESQADMVLVDGNKKIRGYRSDLQQTLVKGDSLSAGVAAASVLAKVTRDRIMRQYHEQYEIYNFDKNKGYGTAAHIKKIEINGLSPVHRRTFCDHFFIQTSLDLK